MRAETGRFEATKNHLLREFNSHSTETRNLVSDFDCRVEKLRSVNDSGHETSSLSFLYPHVTTGQHKFARTTRSNDSWQNETKTKLGSGESVVDSCSAEIRLV